ncbi:MAG: ABC transporter ATP-binding protein [Acidobacteria bacterium]|nr:ABC transporter ATP-binding protein [Acidobacteriota bacterium]
MICEVQDLCKSYPSGFCLGPLTFKINGGDVVGLIGENGSGKTTLIRLLMGVLKRDSGRLQVLGRKTGMTDIKGNIGYVDEESILYEWMSTRLLGRFLSHLYRRWDAAAFQNYLERFGIDPLQQFGKLSRGNKLRVSVLLALARHPKFILMDEPTSGLDPMVRRELLVLLKEYLKADASAAVLFSSHIISDLEKICTRVIMLDAGKLILDQPLTITVSGGDVLEELYFKSVAKKRNASHSHQRPY